MERTRTRLKIAVLNLGLDFLAEFNIYSYLVSVKHKVQQEHCIGNTLTMRQYFGVDEKSSSNGVFCGSKKKTKLSSIFSCELEQH